MIMKVRNLIVTIALRKHKRFMNQLWISRFHKFPELRMLEA